MSRERLFLKFLLCDIAPDAQYANYFASFILNDLRTVANLRETTLLADHSGFEPDDTLGFNLLTIDRQCLLIIVRVDEFGQRSKRIVAIGQFFNLAPFGIQV